jgi:tetratricopeptide (TPR) repeat protein
MAEAKPHRLTRKDLRQPDEFQTLTGEALGWLQRHQSLVIGVASTVVALAAIVLGIEWNSRRQATAASVRLQAAQALFDDDKYAEAAGEYASVAETYPRTPAGRLAVLYRAHALAHQGDASGAATAYGEYLADGPATEYLRQEALLGLARAHEAAGDANAAIDAYKHAIDVAGPFRIRAQLGLARLHDASGNSDAARALYAEISKAPDLDPDSRQFVVSRLPPGEASEPPREVAPQP